MNYKCDAMLGSPSVTDCEKLMYQGLGKNGTVDIGPGKTKIFVEGECAIGVAAVTLITLICAQITTASTTLVDTCIESPLGSYGGRAFAGVVTDSFWIPSGMKKRDNTITGPNALPNCVNVTTWKHTGATANVVCEFRAANNQKPVAGVPIDRISQKGCYYSYSYIIPDSTPYTGLCASLVCTCVATHLRRL